jgi:hypothetical protein
MRNLTGCQSVGFIQERLSFRLLQRSLVPGSRNAPCATSAQEGNFHFSLISKSNESSTSVVKKFPSGTFHMNVRSLVVRLGANNSDSHSSQHIVDYKKGLLKVFSSQRVEGRLLFESLTCRDRRLGHGRDHKGREPQ